MFDYRRGNLDLLTFFFGGEGGFQWEPHVLGNLKGIYDYFWRVLQANRDNQRDSNIKHCIYIEGFAYQVGLVSTI